MSTYMEEMEEEPESRTPRMPELSLNNILPDLPNALCKGDLKHADDYFPNKGFKLTVVAETIERCHYCLDRRPCIKFAIEERMDYGIWGGWTAYQRKRNRDIVIKLEGLNG